MKNGPSVLFVPVLGVVIVEWGRYMECATVWTIDTDKADFLLPAAWLVLDTNRLRAGAGDALFCMHDRQCVRPPALRGWRRASGGKMPGGRIRYPAFSDKFYGGCSVRIGAPPRSRRGRTSVSRRPPKTANDFSQRSIRSMVDPT